MSGIVTELSLTTTVPSTKFNVTMFPDSRDAGDKQVGGFEMYYCSRVHDPIWYVPSFLMMLVRYGTYYSRRSIHSLVEQAMVGHRIGRFRHLGWQMSYCKF